MSRALSLPRKVAFVLLPCVALLTLAAVWELIGFLSVSDDISDAQAELVKLGQMVLLGCIVVGAGLTFGFVQRIRRQLRTRSRYLLWTVAALYFLAATYLVLRFSGWNEGSVAVGVVCIVALGVSIWGATAERQRTIEYTLFPRRPRRTGQREKNDPPVKQEA